jgi:hypothetical protein
VTLPGHKSENRPEKAGEQPCLFPFGSRANPDEVVELRHSRLK